MQTVTFERTGDVWVGTFAGAKNSVVQISRVNNSPMRIMASLPDMPPATILKRGTQYYTGAEDNFIFRNNLPDGIQVTIESESRVLACVISEA